MKQEQISWRALICVRRGSLILICIKVTTLRHWSQLKSTLDSWAGCNLILWILWPLEFPVQMSLSLPQESILALSWVSQMSDRWVAVCWWNGLNLWRLRCSQHGCETLGRAGKNQGWKEKKQELKSRGMEVGKLRRKEENSNSNLASRLWQKHGCQDRVLEYILINNMLISYL